MVGRTCTDTLSFPSAFEHELETEGLGKMAIAMGYQPYGMPQLVITHKD